MQELMKWNEELERRVHLETPTMSQSQHIRNDNDDKTHSPKNSRSEDTTQLTPSSN